MRRTNRHPPESGAGRERGFLTAGSGSAHHVPYASAARNPHRIGDRQFISNRQLDQFGIEIHSKPTVAFQSASSCKTKSYIVRSEDRTRATLVRFVSCCLVTVFPNKLVSETLNVSAFLCVRAVLLYGPRYNNKLTRPYGFLCAPSLWSSEFLVIQCSPEWVE